MPDENPNKEVLANIEQNLEHSVIATTETTKAVKELEPTLEALLVKVAEVAKNTTPVPPEPEEEKEEGPVEIKIPGVSIITLKGDPGVKGDEPSDERLIEIVKPIIIANIPDPIPGEKGKDADNPTDEHLLSLILPNIPDPIPGPEGPASVIPGPEGKASTVPGPKGEPGPAGSPDTAEKIIEKIKGKFSYEDLKDWNTLRMFIESKKETTKPSGSPVSSKTYSLREMDDVSMQGIVAGQVLQWDGTRLIPYTPSSSGVTQVFGEVIGSAGSAAFTLAHTPVLGSVRVYRGGSYQQGGVGKDYTIAGAAGTLSSVLQSGEILLADYNY